MAVILRNRTKKHYVFGLPHAKVCTEAQCLCTRQKVGVQDHNPATGEKTLRAVRQRLQGSVSLNAAGTDGSETEPLPNGAARLPEVRALVLAGALEVTVVPDPWTVASGEPSAKTKTSKPAALAAKE